MKKTLISNYLRKHTVTVNSTIRSDKINILWSYKQDNKSERNNNNRLDCNSKLGLLNLRSGALATKFFGALIKLVRFSHSSPLIYPYS